MLYSTVERAISAGALLSREAWHPLPRISEREPWQKTGAETRAYFAGAVSKYKGFTLPALPSARYMDFVQDGDRKRFENMYFERRRALYTLMFSECLNNEGEFVSDIANLIWAICEESSWVVPAHNNQSSFIAQGQVNALPDIEEDPPYIDLFSAETASLLSWAYYLMAPRLSALSPLIPRRIELEVERRVLAPYLARDDMRWMGFADDEPVNNWNPWINSNVLACALIMEAAPDRRAELALKIAKSAQRFLDFYAPDGGCDEGPGYFNVAGASILDTLELYDEATSGKASVYDQPLIQNMARYIMHAHISGHYHINFADASAYISPDAMLLRRAALRMGLDDLKAYAEGALGEGYAAAPYLADYSCIFRRLRNALTYNGQDFAGKRAPEALSHSFAGIQVAFARRREDGEGLYFAAKGGNNAESHNHNDIGNYIIYLNGEPVVCDAGVETYRRQTFSAERYNIWTMKSRYHNTAIVNGCDQWAGAQYAARDFAFSDYGNEAVFNVDISHAYSDEAHLSAYNREIRFNRETDEICVTDAFELSECDGPFVLPILCAAKPRLAPGEAQIPAGKRAVRLGFDAAAFTATVECVSLNDPQLKNAWKRPALYRLLLTRTDTALSGKFTLRYRA